MAINGVFSVAKYYLNVMLNDNPILTITSGKLKEVDDFLIDNNICNVEQLYEHIKDNINEKLSNDILEFAIEYKYNGEIKTKPLIFKDELVVFKKCDTKADFIFQKLKKDKMFKKYFDRKYINKFIPMDKKTPIYYTAMDYIHNFNFKAFDSLYHSLMYKRVKSNLGNKKFTNAEDLENAMTDKKYSYTTDRDMYFTTYYFDKGLPERRLIVSNIEKPYELEEEIEYGVNATEGLRVNGIQYEKFIEQQNTIFDISEEVANSSKLQSVKKKVKTKKIDIPNQISFFE